MGRAAYFTSWRVLPVPAREEAEEREDKHDDQDDPENAHSLTPFLILSPGSRVRGTPNAAAKEPLEAALRRERRTFLQTPRPVRSHQRRRARMEAVSRGGVRNS